MKSMICQLAWKTKDYNVLLSFYPYLQDNPCLQDNDSYPFSNLIFNQIQTLKKNEFDWNFVSHTRRDSGTINKNLSDAREEGERRKKNPRGEQTQKTPRGGHYKREQKKNQEQREERLKREGHHSLVGARTVTFNFTR